MDWKHTIETLCAAFGDQKTVARLANIEQSALTRMKKGELTRVSYETGCRLVDLERRAKRILRHRAAK